MTIGSRQGRLTRISLITLALVAGGAAVGVVSAQTAPAAAQAKDYASIFLGRLAAALGTDQATLKAALQQAGSATVEEALANQDITRQQADRLRQAAQEGRLGLFEHGHGQGGLGRGGPLLGLDGTTLEAAATALGVSASELTTQLRSGQTLEQVAQARGVEAQKVRDAVAGALAPQLEAAVTAGRLSRSQADQALESVREGTRPRLELRGGPGRHGPRMRGRFGPRGLSPDAPDATPPTSDVPASPII